MDEKLDALLKDKLGDEHYKRLMAVPNPTLHAFVADAVELCAPDTVYVCTDAAEDIAYVRSQAVERNEEKPLKTPGHTMHYDGPKDQGRDKGNTKYLVPADAKLGASLNQTDRESGVTEIRGYLKDAMKGRQMIVRFFCLGPTKSPFSISAVQVTDSFYVGHSEDLLYRSGYEQFKTIGDSNDFFRVVHSAGKLEGNVSVEVDKRRVFIDYTKDTVYTVNTQYAGNTVGFKKLALRLAIRKADREGWLAEHMFVMGAHGPDGRVTHFVGAFPSACGKTSTAMIPGEMVIGDDLAYLRKIDGDCRAVNVESGIFGIIRNVNSEDDPELWQILTSEGEVIFSNILDADGVPYWQGDNRDAPKQGVNFVGEWHEGMKDANGNEIPLSHFNARYTIRLEGLRNLDPKANAPEGVTVGGIIYGGRDADTNVPVRQAMDWTHGVCALGASLESETTAATLGKSGVRSFQPMSNKDFISLDLGKYIQNHLDFGASLKKVPAVFGVNYFQKSADGAYLTGMKHKYVWLKWMERRANGELEAIPTPTGNIPVFDDLVTLFKDVLGLDYTKEQYVEQFTVHVPQNLAQLDRVEKMYKEDVTDTPQIFFDTLAAQRKRLEEAKAAHGEHISPETFA